MSVNEETEGIARIAMDRKAILLIVYALIYTEERHRGLKEAYSPLISTLVDSAEDLGLGTMTVSMLCAFIEENYSYAHQSLTSLLPQN